MIDRDPALVKFRAYRDYISIRTISRKHKSPQSFTLPRPSFTDLEADGYLLLDDGYSFALFRLIEDGAMVQIDFTWLVKYSDNTLKGYAETVVLGYDRLAQWIWDSSEENGPETWSMFSPGYTSQRPRLDFSSPGAQETIRHVLAVPVLRHKLTRAFRDFFQWPRTGTLLAVYNGEYRGGTAATIRYARKLDREIIIIDPATGKISQDA